MKGTTELPLLRLDHLKPYLNKGIGFRLNNADQRETTRGSAQLFEENVSAVDGPVIGTVISFTIRASSIRVEDDNGHLVSETEQRDLPFEGDLRLVENGEGGLTILSVLAKELVTFYHQG